ncbi:MAG: hypothetical protein V3S69_03410 [Dehalococcoidales bacterium]
MVNLDRRKEDNERLAVLEIRVENHEEDLRQMSLHQEMLSKGIANIDKTLRMIFWSVCGACGLLIAQQLGVVEFLKLFIK